MVTETGDRKVDTDEKMRDDGAKRLPHARDESPEGRDQPPRGVMKQAADDLAQGLVDTDLHGIRGVELVVPQGGPAGQARPQPDASQGMRDHDSTIPSRGKNQ